MTLVMAPKHPCLEGFREPLIEQAAVSSSSRRGRPVVALVLAQVFVKARSFLPSSGRA